MFSMPSAGSPESILPTRRWTFETVTVLRLLQRHRPRRGVVSRHVVAVGLLGIAIDERTPVERVLRPPAFVLEREQPFAAFGVDEILEAILMLIALFGDQLLPEQPLVRSREI